MAKKRFYFIILIFVGLMISVPMLAMFDSSNKTGVDAIEAAIMDEEMQLLYIGSESCPFCEQYDPVIEGLAQSENFDYLYIDLDALSSAEKNRFFGLLASIRPEDNFGVPLTLLVANGSLIDELNGYNERAALKEFLVRNDFIANGDDSAKPNEEETNIELAPVVAEIEAALASPDKEFIFVGSKTCPFCSCC